VIILSKLKKSSEFSNLTQKFPHHKAYEEYAYVLDYLPYGRGRNDRYTSFISPVVQLIGERHFTLLEASLKPGVSASPHEKLYIGRETRDKVLRVVGRISFNDLTATAKSELESVLEKMVEAEESRFVVFFNNSSAVTPRMHSLELLPGIGKKLMWQIIEEREKKSFISFKDLKDRVGISDPLKIIAKRILEELVGESKYRRFTR
jgi:putative nucleotide binding protein